MEEPMSVVEETMTVLEAHDALDEVLRKERKVLTQAQEQVNAINAKREQAMQDLREGNRRRVAEPHACPSGPRRR